MSSEQTHIINKLILDVNTNNTNVAYSLKDKLDVFVKHEIFPYLENYFKSLERDLPSKIVQIPKLTITLNTTSKNNFEELKEIIKKQAVAQIQQILKAPTQGNKKAVFLNEEESKLQTFLFFLEEGISPWWNSNKKRIFFTDDEISEVVKANHFITKLNRKLHNPQVQNRLINQFTDQQIQQILHAVFNTNSAKISILQSSIVKKIKRLKASNRTLIWQSILSYLVDDNKQILIHQLRKVIDNIQEKNAETEIKYLKDIIKIILKKADIQTFNKDDTDEELKTDKKLDKTNPIGEIKASVQKEINPKSTEESQVFSEKSEKNNEKIEEGNEENFKNEFQKTTEKIHEFNFENSILDNNKSELNQEKEIQNNDNLHINNKTDSAKVNNESLKELLFTEDDKNDYYVENAGLIILHPYLKHFFENCKLLDENSITNPELATHILHYIATKKEEQFENHMVFEKFLCGIPIQQSIKRKISISKDIKLKIEELLEAVIENWGVLKNASPDLLRNEFLQRSGKLSFKENNPKIIIERKTHDILVDKLPWTISLSKLPWVKKIIFTDW